MADRSVSVPMTSSDLERLDARNQFLLQADLLITLVFLTYNHQIRQDNTCGKKRISTGQPRAPTARGRYPSAPQFGGSLMFMHIPIDAELSNVTR